MVEQQPVELGAIAREVWERARATDGGRHALDLECNDAAIVRGDRHWLRQLLWNLVENALRYTPAGGSVTLSLRCRPRVAEFTVTDTGIGIPPEHLPRIFERFYRVDPARSRQRGGTGLGLAVVKHVAEAHGGHVRVRSAPGSGTVVTVALPLAPS
jgi:two-component system phosphate regulon sensor histidine kinase PhoR